MSYIRIKHRRNRNGNEYEYAYLVERLAKDKQKIKKYLGRVYGFQMLNIGKHQEVDWKQGVRGIVLDLFGFELINHGFSHKGKRYFFRDNIIVDLNKLKVCNDKGRKVVLQLNAGFVCDWSIRNLLNIKLYKDFDKEKILFGKKVILVGLNLRPEVIFRLYERWKRS